MEVDVDQLERDAKQINSNLVVIQTSIRKDIGIDEIIQHLGL
ncbi:MAG: hypothetical protein ACXACF_07420 [Candidatus Hermodarchaeia archaeon]|jgi:Ni2+-binding GTPase involved in maturation of urease and hydrogenase